MRFIFTSMLALFLTTSTVFGQNSVDVDVSQNWIAFMNVFELPANGGGYAFGDFWALDDVKTVLNTADNTITLQPNFNTYAGNPTDPFWVDQTTMLGNKDMEANTFVEPGETFNGQDLVFSGNVISSTLAEGYAARFFIKALDPNNGFADALGGTKIIDLPESGPFTVSATGAELAAGLVIQYGFIIRGTNANPADEAALGNVVVGSFSTSTENLENLAKASVYPNPANDLLSITSEALVQSYEIKNLTGQLLMKGTDTQINIADLTSGMYVVTLDLGDRKEAVKFVKN